MRMKRWFAITLLMLCALAQPAWAAERAWITTDGTMAYSDEAWVAVGGVRLVQGELEVTADQMRYEVEDGRIDFIGNVHVTRADGQVSASAFTYDVHSASGQITDALAQIEVEEYDGPLYIMGDEIQFDSGKTQVTDARLTTCTPPQDAGYYLISRRMDIFPGERVVIRSVRFVESGMTLFYWPYLSIPLDPNRGTGINFPEIGHNPTDGWYIKTRYGYDGPGEGHGEVALDVMQHRGVGTGVHHVYRDQGESEGSVTVYQLRPFGESDREWRLGWDESFQMGRDANVSWKSAYLASPTGDGAYEREARVALDLSHSADRMSTRVDWEREQYWDVDPGRADRLTIHHRSRPLDWQWQLQVDAFSRRRVGYDDRDVVGYTNVLRRSFGPFALQVDAENRAHYGWLRGTSTLPSWKSRTRLPEATLTLDVDALTPMRLPLEIGLSYGRLGEVRRAFTGYETVQADRGIVNFALKPMSLDLGRLGRLQSRGGLAWQAYSSGERRVVVSADHQYRLGLTPRLSLYSNYSYQQPIGDNSPFDFDALSYQERVSGRLQYAYGMGNLILSSGYDFANRSFSDVVGQMTFRGGRGFYGTVQGGYSLASRRMSYAAANVSIRPSSGFEVNASTRYDFATQQLDALGGSLAFGVPGWRLLYSTDYDSEEGWISGDAALIRDLGCREIGLRFDSLDGAVWLEYKINAFPGDGIRLGASRDRFMFDPDSITSLF